jgi:hypothetical protein
MLRIWSREHGQSETKTMNAAIIGLVGVLAGAAITTANAAFARSHDGVNASHAAHQRLVADLKASSEMLGSVGKPVTIGVAFNYGSGDIKSGYVNLQIWNLDGDTDLDGHAKNAGVLYLVVEETPPADPAATIRTVTELPPLNPTEFWSPGFSSMRPTPIPVVP